MQRKAAPPVPRSHEATSHHDFPRFIERASPKVPPKARRWNLSERHAKAFLNADAAALDRVLTADFTLTVCIGEVITRADEINESRNGKVRYEFLRTTT